MGNNANKRQLAEKFNTERKERLAKEELIRIDKLNNPEKYASSKSAKKRAHMLLATLYGMGAV